MKIYILTILLLSYVLSKRVPPLNMEFPNEIGKIKVTKALQVKTIEEDYIEKIDKLDVPNKVKEWVKTLNASKLNSKSNIDLLYNKTIGGYAKGDLYYFYKNKEEYTFKYGSAEVVLKPLKPIKRYWCPLKAKCGYYSFPNFYNEKQFRRYVIRRMRNAIQSSIYNKYKPKKNNNTKNI